MGSDSEIAEIGRHLTEERKRRKAIRTNRWADRDHERLFDFLSETYNSTLIGHTEHHFTFTVVGVKYDYWPSNNRLRTAKWKDSKFMNVDKLIPFLKARHPVASPQS